MTDQGGRGEWPPQQGPDAQGPDVPGHQQPTQYLPSQQPAPYQQPGAHQQPGGYEQPGYAQNPYQQPSSYPQPGPYQQPGQQQTPYQQPGQYAAPAPYQQPGSYQQPYEQPQPYQQPYEQAPAPSYGGYPPGGYGSPTGALPGPPARTRSTRKIALIIGIVVVLVAGLGVGAWALFLRGGPAVTWQGKEIANADALLTQAQGDLTTLVADVKGVKADSTRCWFAVPTNPPNGTPATDVTDTVYCGPALFVDGDTSKPFVPYTVAAGSSTGGKITLTVSAKGTENGATAVPAGQKLVRPDGVAAPSGSGGLAVPQPPPADANVFTAISGVTVPAAPPGAMMGSLNGGVRIAKLGEITRYGKGSQARSAPTGQKLIAFQLADAAGDGANKGASVLDLTVSVDGAAGKAVPDLTGLNVIAVPTGAKAVDVRTAADGVKQSLSLLTGKPGATNIAVLSRTNRLGSFTVPKGFTFVETGGGARADRPCTLTGSVAGLFYWADDQGTATATRPGNAILETDLKYVFSTNSPPPFTGSKAGDTATFEPSHLTLTLSGGQKVPAKVVANRTVFEVPAGFTDGTITIGGSFTNTNGITFAVPAPVSFKVSIPTS